MLQNFFWVLVYVVWIFWTLLLAQLRANVLKHCVVLSRYPVFVGLKGLKRKDTIPQDSWQSGPGTWIGASPHVSGFGVGTPLWWKPKGKTMRQFWWSDSKRKLVL